MGEMIRKNRIYFVLLILYCLCSAGLFVATAVAENFSIRADVDQRQISLDDSLVLTVTLSGESRNIPTPSIDGRFDDFTIVSGPSQQTSIQIVNMAMTASMTIQYILVPQKLGQLSIPSFTVEYEGKNYTTQPIAITVTDSGSAGSRSADQGDTVSGEAVNEENIKPSFFRYEVPQTTVYVGQQIPLEYVLYTREQVVDLGLKSLPSMTGFWVEEVDMPNVIQKQTKINGVAYNRVIIKRQILFPTAAGSVTIEPIALGLQVRVQSRTRSPFDDFFNDPFFSRARGQTKYVNSRPLELLILPLPEQNKPADFQGVVGEFSIDGRVNRTEVKQGDSITFTVSISGTGNVQAIPEPTIPVINGMKLYPPTVDKTVRKTSQGISGSKSFEYILVPSDSGQLIVPPVSISFFSPELKQYRTIQTEEVLLHAAESDVDTSQPIVMPNTIPEQSEVKLLGQDIHFIKTNIELNDQSGLLIKNAAFLVLQTAPLLLIGLVVTIRKRRESMMQDVAGIRARRAKGLSKKYLKEAVKALKKGEASEFYVSLERSLSNYIADKLNIAAAGLTSALIQENLRERNVEQSIVEDVLKILQTCDYARFAPTTPTNEEMKNHLEEAKIAIQKLEQQKIKARKGSEGR